MIKYYERISIEIRQYVVYIGEGTPFMADHIRAASMYFKYTLIPLSAVDYHLLLRSDHPEEKLLAILANFGADTPEQAINNISKQVLETSAGDFAAKRHLRQLRILAGLRNFKPEIQKIMDSLEGVFTVERDLLYQFGELKGEQKGLIKGEEKGLIKGARNERLILARSLLLNTDFTIAKIASLVNLSEYMVRKIKQSLQ